MSTFAEDVIDELLPTDFDWRQMVRSYPLSAMAVAFGGGFLLGRQRGLGLLNGLTGFVVREVGDNVNALFTGTQRSAMAEDELGGDYDGDAYGDEDYGYGDDS